MSWRGPPKVARAFLTYVPTDASVRVPPIERFSDEERALFAEVDQRPALQRSLASVRRAA